MKKKEKEYKNNFFTNFKNVYQYFKECKKLLILIGIFTLLRSGIGIITPILSAKVILSLTDGIWEQLLSVAVIIFVCEILSSVFYIVHDYLSRKLRISVNIAIKTKLTKEMLDVSVNELDKKGTGVFIERLNGDSNRLASQFLIFTHYVSTFLTSAGILVSVFIINKIMYVFLFGVALINFIFESRRTKIQDSMRKELRKMNENNTSLASEIIRGSRDLKVLNAKKNILDKNIDSIKDSTSQSDKILSVGNKYFMIRAFVSEIGDLLFFVLGIYLCNKSMLSLASFLILYNYRSRVDSFLNSIVYLNDNIKDFNLISERVFEIIEDDSFEKESFGDSKLEKFEGNIEFKNVNFSYDGEKQVLNNLSFTIKPNEKIAFVGKSGSGKSTIFSLLCKLYNVDDGCIFLDGKDINTLDESSIRDNMSLITQEPYIFNFSIKENLLLAKNDASDEEIENACKLACIHDFIMALPDKYDTKLGENGVLLSGGQKQRIAIARALLMKTELILFDEATSALDNETQEEISKAIDNLKGEYTILIVAHRLSTVIGCDKIFVIDEGKIVDIGTHSELMENSEFYRHLYEMEI